MFRSMMQKLFPTAIEPVRDPSGYPFDFDASLRYTRPKTGIDVFPWIGGDGTVSQIGAVSGFLRQNDVAVWGQMMGKVPTGPGSTTVPINLQWQITVPGLSKI